MFCSSCDADRLFEQPPCRDGHGADCPELTCAECGQAIFVADPPLLFVARTGDVPPEHREPRAHARPDRVWAA